MMYVAIIFQIILLAIAIRFRVHRGEARKVKRLHLVKNGALPSRFTPSGGSPQIARRAS